MPSAPSKSTYAINSKGQWLNGNAAASYLRMLAAGCPAGGISGKGAGRTYAEQAALYAAYKAGRGNLAARPGTSLHERGNALDVSRGTSAQLWMVKGGDPYNAKAGEKIRANSYGWVRTVNKQGPTNEPWHFAYDPAKDTKAAADIKARLKALGYADVRSFQRARKLSVDGVPGPQTWTALLLAADAAPKPAPPAEPTPEVPTVPTIPKTAEFTLGVANCQSYDGDKSEKAWKARAAIIARQGWSVVCVVETTSAGRTVMLAELKRLTGHTWKTWTLGGKTVAVLWDDTIWSNPKGADGKGKRRVTKMWSPFGHGGVCVPLVHRKTGLGFDVIAHHTPPGSVATDRQKDAAIAASAKLAKGWPCVLAGDFNTPDPKLPAWIRATRRVDTLDKAGTQPIDAAFIRGKVGAGESAVVDPGSLSDHKWLGVKLTLGGSTL